MAELCKDLTLTIHKEQLDSSGEQVRIQLANPLEMLEVEICYPITEATEKTQASRRYFVKEAVVIALRRAVSEAFNQGLISDSLGTWKITSEPSTPSLEIDFSDLPLS